MALIALTIAAVTALASCGPGIYVSTTNRVERSNNVPIADLPFPTNAEVAFPMPAHGPTGAQARMRFFTKSIAASHEEGIEIA